MKNIALLFLCFTISLSTVWSQNSTDDELFNRAYEQYNQHKYTESFPIFSQLANKGYTEAYGYMGLAYEFGEGVEKNTALMCEWYDRAIQAKQYWCGWRLGNYLAELEQHHLAVKALDMASKYSNFSGRASSLLGKMYEEGIGVDKDLIKAVAYYKTAAKDSFTEHNAIEALKRLGVSLYDDSEFKDATIEMTRGKSAKQLFDLGYDYHTGGIHGKDHPKAYAYFKAAADMNYPEALKWMGYLSTDEAYPIKSKQQEKIYFDQALEEFQKRAKDGTASDYFEIGDFYYRGLGRDKDLDQAAYWFGLGANSGNSSCQLWLGKALDEKGEYEEALVQLERAGNQGQGWAAYLAAEMYEKGRTRNGETVIKQDIKKAVAWYEKAAQTNNYYASKAKEALTRLGY